MRQQIFNLVFLAIMISLLLFSGCRDKCKSVDCLNGGKCVEGTCNCLTGFTGDRCDLRSSDLIVGTYNVTDNCNPSGAHQYTTNIFTDSLTAGVVTIANFFNAFSNVVAATFDGHVISIPLQDPDNSNVQVTGSGVVSGDTIRFNYQILDGNSGITDVCNNSIWVR